jgi:hypothetical protein
MLQVISTQYKPTLFRSPRSSHAMAQGAGCMHHTAKARVLFQVSPWEICGEQIGTGTASSPSAQAVPCMYQRSGSPLYVSALRQSPLCISAQAVPWCISAQTVPCMYQRSGSPLYVSALRQSPLCISAQTVPSMYQRSVCLSVRPFACLLANSVEQSFLRKSPLFIKSEFLSQYSQQTAACPYHEPDKSNSCLSSLLLTSIVIYPPIHAYDVMALHR